MALSRLASKVRRGWRRLTGREAEWIVRKRTTDLAFDSAHGVDTGGLTPVRDLPGAPAGNDGVDHIAVDPDHFAEAMAALDIDFRRYTFVDLGAGKGRALMLAAQFPFAHLIGVEFAEELAAIARANIARLSLTDPAMGTIEIVAADAAEFDLPPAPTVLFLYNPFGAATMGKVVRNVRASLARAPRELFVIYLNPLHLPPWREGFVEAARGKHFVLLKLR